MLNHIFLLLITKYVCANLLPLTFSNDLDITVLHHIIYIRNGFVQIKQIRMALAISSLLNRTLVRKYLSFCFISLHIFVGLECFSDK